MQPPSLKSSLLTRWLIIVGLLVCNPESLVWTCLVMVVESDKQSFVSGYALTLLERQSLLYHLWVNQLIVSRQKLINARVRMFTIGWYPSIGIQPIMALKAE
jgi:hypothetical protein